MGFSRRTFAAALLSTLLLFNPASAAVDRAECLRTRSEELAALSACGHHGSINYCLSQLPKLAHLCTAEVLETCFVNAGCTADEARIEASWTIKRCDENAASQDLGDLRRRQRGGNNADDESSDVPKQTNKAPTKVAPTQNAKTTDAPKTTAPKPAPTPEQTTAEPTPTPDQPTAAQVTTPGSTAATGSTTSRLVCYTTTTVSTTTCPVQSTGPQSGKETLPCFPTQVSFPTCAAGLLCRTDQQGNPVCMKVDNSLSTAGVIISLFFAIAVTAALAAMCFFCCRERRVQNRLHKAAEAAAIAKAAALDKKRPSVGVRSVSGQSGVSDQQPLMHPNQGLVYQQDPFADQHQMR